MANHTDWRRVSLRIAQPEISRRRKEKLQTVAAIIIAFALVFGAYWFLTEGMDIIRVALGINPVF